MVVGGASLRCVKMGVGGVLVRVPPRRPLLFLLRSLSQSIRNLLSTSSPMDVFCSGSLLDRVQSCNIFPDCKHFVDMPLKTDATSVLSKWSLLLEKGVPQADEVRRFVEENFSEPGSELEECIPLDFEPEGLDVSSIVDEDYKQWARALHLKWPTLYRRIRSEVLNEPHRFSLLPLPHPFVVPGGRFRELYYWDSFFTIKGLLASKMFVTVRGMILNMKWLIEQYGFIPNGNRVYYLNRSQPPLLTWCVHAYALATNDIEFVREMMPVLRKELMFFDNYRSINLVNGQQVYRFHCSVDGPRPESYREDVECASHLVDAGDRRRLWGDIAAAAESGRDFSSRWFESSGELSGHMSGTRTSEVLPVDLNAIVCGNFRLMAELYRVLGEEKEAEWAEQRFHTLRKAIREVFWSEEEGMWFDYDLRENKLINVFFDSHLLPLYTDAIHEDLDVTRVVEYLERNGLLSFPGGIPTSLHQSGQQWDFPNAWAPTTWLVVEGLRKTGQEKVAIMIAEKWLRRNYSSWETSGGAMFEKYDVVTTCSRNLARGGEYEVQEGFGWTNGVILDLLLSYSRHLTPPPKECAHCVEEALKENIPPIPVAVESA